MPTESPKKKVCVTCQKEYSADSELANCPLDNTPLFLAPTDLVGATVADKYCVESLAGYDNCLTLYSVRRKDDGSRLTMKVLPLNLNGEERVARFNLQLQALTKVTHDGLMQMFDYGVLPEGRPYVITENLQGGKLSQLISARVLSPAKTLELLIQVCDALSVAHSAAFFHCGITPANLIVSSNAEGLDRVKVADLGLIRFLLQDRRSVAEFQTVVPCMNYASPEQTLDRIVDGRSDVYSLGCILYEGLTGRRPYEGKTGFDIAAKHASAIMPLPFSALRSEHKLPVVLENIVFKAMAKDPTDRYQTVNELRSAMDQARASVEAPHVVQAFSGLLTQRKEGMRREKALVRLGKFVMVGVLLIALLLITQSFWHYLG